MDRFIDICIVDIVLMMLDSMSAMLYPFSVPIVRILGIAIAFSTQLSIAIPPHNMHSH